MSDAIVSIAVSYIRPYLKKVDGIDERFRVACREAHKFWMSTDNNIRLKAALASTLLETADPYEKDRFERSIRSLATFSALLNDVPIDLDKFAEEAFSFEPVPIFGIWLEEGGVSAG